MGLVLLAILIAPLPLMLALTGFGMLGSQKPVHVERSVRFNLPRRRH